MNGFINSYSDKPWIKHYDRHVPEYLEYPHVSLIDMLENAINKNPDKRFLSFSERDYTYQEIGNYVNNLSASLMMEGLEKGQRVALILPNIPQFVIAYYAILKAGGVVVAMNPNYKITEFEFLFNDSEPVMVICLKCHLPLLKEIGFSERKIFLVKPGSITSVDNNKTQGHQTTFQDFDKICLRSHSNNDIDFPEINLKDPAIFQYSGGTTGIPKAAIGTHLNIVANITQFNSWCRLIDGQETILAVIPLYHVYGMVLTMNLAIAARSEVVLIDDPGDIDRILSEIEFHKVTFYPGVPAMYYAINQHPRVRAGDFDISSIKACISGSTPLHPNIKAEFEKLTGGKLVEGYGLSEAPTATHCNPVFGLNKIGSIGLPLPDVECRVMDMEYGLREVPVGEPGELVIKGPQIMAGYHKQPQEEVQALRDRWLYTGDVVKMDEEGYFFIVDRKKSLIKVSGFQVWPNEVENIISTYPGVAACAVGGVPDLRQGEKVVAWIVGKPESKLYPEWIREWCREKLVHYKVPSEVFFVKALPKNGVGKVLRRELIRQYLEGIK